MPPTRVAVIGAGLAGPTLAIFLKHKGYEPVVFERHAGVTGIGLGLIIQSNGLRALDKVPGLRATIGGYSPDSLSTYSVVGADKGFLGSSDFLRQAREHDGYGVVAIRRSDLQKGLVEFGQKDGIEIRWNHSLVALHQSEDGVDVIFENGVQESFSFVVGCDGLHSSARACLFGEQPATYTGLVQIGGLSPFPQFLRDKGGMVEVYGDGGSMIAIPIAHDTIMWALTQRESESRESWRSIDEEAMKELKDTSPFSQWDFGAGELVRTSRKMTKYGLYDRPELECWHKGRVVLLGDAAHPTTPHVGQGANQSFVDVDTLVSVLETHNPTASSPSTSDLEIIFNEFEEARRPHTSMIVKHARAIGERKVVTGLEACVARNDWCRKLYAENRLHDRWPK